MNNTLTQNKEEIFLLVKKASDFSGEEIINKIKKANIVGMGGAGFPAWIKWDAVKKSVSLVKYVVANGHEGEPYTLKDKFLMGNFPHQVIAGMLIAAKAVSSNNLYIVINGSYKEEFEILKKAIKDFQKENLLGDININISKAEDRYIGGEESALLNELEGKRIQPRLKTPLVCNCGLNGAPTIINNIETYVNVASLILKGAPSYKENNKKLVTIAGDVKNPGVYEIKIGDSLESAIKLAGGFIGKVKFAIVGGYSGNVIVPQDFKKNLTFKFSTNDIYFGAGTIIVYNHQTKVLDVVKNLFEFYKNESCGQCTPCREGTMRVFEIVVKAKGKISKQDKEKIDELIFSMDSSSFCAFGQCVGMAAKGLFENFGKELLSGK